MTEGTSAAFTTRSAPETTERGEAQPVGDRSDIFSVACEPARSIQLRIARSAAVVSCGAELSFAAGDVSGSMVSIHSRSGDADTVTSITAIDATSVPETKVERAEECMTRS